MISWQLCLSQALSVSRLLQLCVRRHPCLGCGLDRAFSRRGLRSLLPWDLRGFAGISSSRRPRNARATRGSSSHTQARKHARTHDRGNTRRPRAPDCSDWTPRGTTECWVPGTRPRGTKGRAAYAGSGTSEEIRTLPDHWCQTTMATSSPSSSSSSLYAWAGGPRAAFLFAFTVSLN